MVDAAGAHASRLLGPHQAAGFEHLQMLVDGRQRHVERLRELADRGRPARQSLDDDAPSRIGESLEDAVERSSMVKQALKCLTPSHAMQSLIRSLLPKKNLHLR